MNPNTNQVISPQTNPNYAPNQSNHKWYAFELNSKFDKTYNI